MTLQVSATALPIYLPPDRSIPAHARGSGERHRLGRRCHRMRSPCRGPLAWQTRRRLGRAVVSVWSVELAKPPQSRHSLRAFPQVRALQPSLARTPKAGVAGSNLPRRTGCLCWSGPLPRRLRPSRLGALLQVKRVTVRQIATCGRRVVAGHGQRLRNGCAGCCRRRVKTDPLVLGGFRGTSQHSW
jgi:hypothetical protein